MILMLKMYFFQLEKIRRNRTGMSICIPWCNAHKSFHEIYNFTGHREPSFPSFIYLFAYPLVFMSGDNIRIIFMIKVKTSL